MGKVNRHPYRGATVYFATKHSKELALRPTLAKIGLKCVQVAIDTDQFGTFTGEVERKGSIKETLRKKTDAVFLKRPKARLAMASEGSFGPDPRSGIGRTDHEAILFVDKQLGIEVYAEEISTDTNHAEIEFGPRDDLHSFLKKVKYPKHAVIVRPKGVDGIVYKGLQSMYEVGQAVIDGFMASPEIKVLISTDMRANFNPTRMKVIKKTASKLVKRLNSFCPQCNTLGFWPTRTATGLICEGCGLETQVVKDLTWTCLKCTYKENRARHDGKTSVDPRECQFCNP